MSITEAELDKWKQEQAAFFGTLGEEEPYNVQEIAYVELLQQLLELDSKCQQWSNWFLDYNPLDSDQAMYAAQISQTRKLETECRIAMEQYNQTLMDILIIEEKLNITDQ